MAVRPLSPALAQKARVELGETPELLAASLKEIKDWIATQPHLRARTDDQWLAAFLRGCKYRLDLVKARIDLYYTLRSTAPELFPLKHSDPRIKQVLDLGSAILIQKVQIPDGPRVYTIRFGSYNPKEWTIQQVMAAVIFQFQVSLMEDENLTVAGLVSVIDISNTYLSHYLQVSLKNLKHFLQAFTESLPVRVKEAHIVGTSYLFETMMNIVKKFLSKKINKRIYAHSSMETLYKHVPKEILPVEMGGTGSPIQENIDYWKQKFDDYSDFFEEDLQFGTDESLRGKEKKSKARLEID